MCTLLRNSLLFRLFIKLSKKRKQQERKNCLTVIFYSHVHTSILLMMNPLDVLVVSVLVNTHSYGCWMHHNPRKVRAENPYTQNALICWQTGKTNMRNLTGSISFTHSLLTGPNLIPKYLSMLNNCACGFITRLHWKDLWMHSVQLSIRSM